MAATLPSRGSTTVFARAIQVAREAGMDGASLRELHGHDGWEERGWLWGRIMRAVRVDGFPVRVAQGYSVGEMGPLGMAAQCAPDLRGAFQRMILHQRVLTGTEISRMHDEPSRGITVFEQLPIEGRELGARCRREMMIASGLKLVRDVSGVRVRPRRVYFAHPGPRDTSEHEAFFDCEVRFGAGWDGLEFDRDTLSTPLPGADADLSQFLVEHLRAITGELPTTATLEARVRQAVCRRLANQTLAMTAVAQELGMSARTLRRRLLEQRISYHEIVDRVRCELADELLRESAHKISEVAFLLGFSDASAFHRAYVRWTGRTPASGRRIAATPEPPRDTSWRAGAAGR